jgi:hypothetical protein
MPYNLEHICQRILLSPSSGSNHTVRHSSQLYYELFDCTELLTVITLYELHYYRIPQYIQFSVLCVISLMFTCFFSLVYLLKKYITPCFSSMVNASLCPQEIKTATIYGAVGHLFCSVQLELNLFLHIYKVSFFCVNFIKTWLQNYQFSNMWRREIKSHIWTVKEYTSWKLHRTFIYWCQ